MVPWIAYHEAGHAVATVLAFRHALWLPRPPPQPAVRYIEIVQRDGEWGGSCAAREIYSMKWPIDVIKPNFRPLMEAQVIISLAGGVAEAIYRGEHRDVLAFATAHCNVDVDLENVKEVLGDLRRLTGIHYDARDFVGATVKLLQTHWRAVEALATELIEDHYVCGERIEKLVARVVPISYGVK